MSFWNAIWNKEKSITAKQNGWRGGDEQVSSKGRYKGVVRTEKVGEQAKKMSNLEAVGPDGVQRFLDKEVDAMSPTTCREYASLIGERRINSMFKRSRKRKGC